MIEYSRLPWFRALSMDPFYHAQWARRLLENGWSDPEPFFRAPIYVYFLAAIQSVTGELLWSARLVQVALGIVTVVLVHRIALRLLPRRAALAAGILAALLWSPIHHETELLLEPLLTFLTTLLLFLMVRAWGEPMTGLRLFAWGMLGGIACATRPNTLLFMPALPLYALFAAGSGKRSAGEPLRSRLRRLPGIAALCLAGFLVPVLPIWIHNARHGDPATVLAWQGGINFYLGNNPEATGWAAVAPGMRTDWKGGYEDALRLAQEGSGSAVPLRPSKVSDYWTRQGLRFWTGEPGRALALLFRKCVFFWGDTEIKNNEDPGFFRRTMNSLRWLPVSFGVLAPLALLGIILALRRDARWRLLSGFVAVWFASVVPFFVCARYRLPVAPLLPLFALLLLVSARDWAVRDRRWRPLALSAAGLAALYPGLFADPWNVRGGGFFQSYCNLGDAYVEVGDFTAAEAAYRKSIELNRRFPSSYNNLAQAQRSQGRLAGAEATLRDGLAVVPEAPQIRKSLALVLETEGKFEESAELLKGLIAQYPQAWDSCMFLGRVEEAQGKPDDALASYRRALAIAPGSVPVRLRAARLQAALGDSTAALDTIEEGLTYAPADGDLRRVRAFLRAALGMGN